MLGPSSVVPPASDEEDRTPGGKQGETVSGRVDWSELGNLTGTPNKLWPPPTNPQSSHCPSSCGFF